MAPGSRNPPPPPETGRRTAVASLVLAAASGLSKAGAARGSDAAPDRRWYDAAVRMRDLALSWGDQAYGAVLVLDGRLVGEGPSRVVRNNDPSAHAEREALRDAIRRLGAGGARGALLYSTSRPCAACEDAAARAGVRRMIFGPALSDGGEPRIGTP